MPSLDEFIALVEESREDGRTAFEAGRYDQAIESWKNGAKFVLKAVCSGPEALANDRLSSLDHIINANLAMAHYKIKDYSTCVMYCDKALLRRKTIPANLLEKNLYRKASAEYELHNYETCVSVCEDLLASFPDNAACRQLLRTTQRDLAAEKKSQKVVYSRLFDKLNQENKELVP